MFSSLFQTARQSATASLMARAYHADNLQVAPRPSRLVQKSKGIVSLQVRSVPDAGRSPEWSTLLAVDVGNDTIASVEEEEQAPLMLAWLRSPDRVIPLEQLYAVESRIWKRFLAHLGEPLLAEMLGLEKHRHLWQGYAFARSAHSLEIAERRARMLSEHHFLLPLALTPFKDFQQFPLYIFNRELEDKAALYESIRMDAYQGKFVPEKMRELHPVFTREFLKKIAHCTSLLEVDRLAWMLNNHADMPGAPHGAAKRLAAATNRMPSSRLTPADFGCMTELSHHLSVMNHVHAAGGFLFNGKTDWTQNRVKLHGFFTASRRDAVFHISDYVNALYNDLIYREIQREFPEAHPEDSANHIYNFPELFHALLADNQCILQMQRLQERWHQNFALLEVRKPLAMDECWEPLIADCQINGITVNVLTSSLALREHGEEMEHCVGGFNRFCLANSCNILRLMDANGTQTTASLAYSRKHPVLVHQHFGARNSPPPLKHARALEELVECINHKKIPLNQARRDALPVFAPRVAYPWALDDDAAQEAVFAAWKGLKLLPSVLDAPNHGAMLARSGIMERLHAFVSHEPRVSIRD
ncbi:PcfJ domain-containing protein [Legionella geestiana]|nr:PcfJ domain-containing protein [Legionella geestiana]QBS12155.1 hypothetical protein E4T54_05030 [Legionella geestiana]QDQ40131.1 hypothetical protein E3226_006810 [Legionella geestiana]